MVHNDEALKQSLESGDLRIIDALSQKGSLTDVARHLGMSQPAVSQRIKRVESKLGVPVIERCGRNVRLTSAGRVLAQHGSKVVREIDRALEKIDALRDGRSGMVRLAGFPSASATIVPDLMAALSRREGSVQLEYCEAEPPEALQLLSAGDVDAALIFDYAGASNRVPAGSVLRPLWREDLRLVVPEQCESEESAQLADFAHAKWIAGCEKCRGNLLAAAAECGFEPDIVQETDNMAAAAAMVAAGGAVALIPELALVSMRGLPRGAKALALLPEQARTIGLVAMRTATESPQLATLRELLEEIDAEKWHVQPV